jgi:signal transduction histidine kinase
VEQLIMNLITNAKEAMPDGGNLTIEAGRCEIEQGFIDSHGFGQPGVFAFLSVADTGKGIQKEIIKRIYEPFFSTKEVGQGNGLGLSQVYGAVKRHKGFIVCESEPGQGARFQIYFPLIEKLEII